MEAKALFELYSPVLNEIGWPTIDGPPALALTYIPDVDPGMQRKQPPGFAWRNTEPRAAHPLGETMHPHVAAALCRVAVEDWLSESVEAFRLNYGRSVVDVENAYVGVRWPKSWPPPSGDSTPPPYEHNDWDAGFVGDTIHHALIAAATAVIKSRK
jgi:hypothetical protein